MIIPIQSLLTASESRDSVRNTPLQSCREIWKYRQILQFRIFRNDPMIKTYFTVLIIICAMSSYQKLYLYNYPKGVSPIKVNITKGTLYEIYCLMKYCLL